MDRAADGDERPGTADVPEVRGADAVRDAGPVRGAAAERHGASRQGDDTSAARVARNLEYRATAEAVDRAYTIDQGCARVQEIEEKTVTPAMRRTEAEDPERHLAGLENRLKGKERLSEKVENWMSAQPDLRPDDAFKLVKDAIRYTFVYNEERYTEGVYADCERIESAGFEPVDRQNSWKEDQYKGINGRWREPDSGMLFEVQFHTQESVDAKELTHPTYERIRDPATSPDEVRELRAVQSEVCSRIKIPPRATEIPDYNYLQEG
jgi:IS5 family transposase